MVHLSTALVFITSLLALVSGAEKDKSKKTPKKASKQPTSFEVTMEATLEIEVKNYDDNGDDFTGEVTVGLFGDTVPASVLNFKALCNGFKRSQHKDKVGYKNTYCHKIVKDMMVQCGDVFNTQGRGSTSIYGDSFNDESFDVSHTSGGIVSYANRGKNSNGSQFFFTVGPSRFFDNKHVAFGKVTKGFQNIMLLNRMGAAAKYNHYNYPRRPVRIVDCEVKEVKPYTLSEKQMKTDDLEGIVKA